MNKANTWLRKSVISIGGIVTGIITSALVYYGSIYFLTHILSTSKKLLQARNSIVPLIIEIVVLITLVFLFVKVSMREKLSRKAAFEGASKLNLQRYIFDMLLGGVLVGLFFMVAFFMSFYYL